MLFVIRVILIAKRRGVRGLKESVGRPLVDSATAEYKIYGLPTSTSDDLINQFDKDARDHARGQGTKNAKPKP